MPSTDREQRTQQEATLFDIYRAQHEYARDKTSGEKFLKNWEKRAMSGMTAEEIDAVKQRAMEASQ